MAYCQFPYLCWSNLLLLSDSPFPLWWNKLLLKIQLFQITLLDQSIKLEDKTTRLCGTFFWINSSNPATPHPNSEDLMASHLNARNFRISRRWGSSCFKDGKSGVSSTLSWVSFSTRNCFSELYSVPVLTSPPLGQQKSDSINSMAILKGFSN